MNIGEAARRSGVSAKMIRYYESIGLVRCSHRTATGYRVYGERDVRILRFLKLARNTGFSTEEIKDLLSLWLHPIRRGDAGATARAYVQELDKRIQDAIEMRDALNDLAQSCDDSTIH